ncbi:MAG: ABC transporter ATP-binding protein [bacterium]|nr:ABC transporter ATP-binding protein [bacterium]
MIELRGIGRDYASGDATVHALSDVDLEIETGEMLTLLGPSGSGKSTLLHLLGCLDRPTHGSYHLLGRDVSRLDRNQLAAVRGEQIGFVFQRFHLMPRSTALENVALPLRFAGVGARERRARAADLLRRVGLEDRRHHRPAELSGGQQQRVAIARALAADPPLILADEPTGNLDSQVGGEIVDLLLELHSEGRTVVVITHDEGLAARTERTVRLLDGRVFADERVAPDNG